MSSTTWKENPYALDLNFPYKKEANDYVVKEIKLFRNGIQVDKTENFEYNFKVRNEDHEQLVCIYRADEKH
jgi:hypothetical protein